MDTSIREIRNGFVIQSTNNLAIKRSGNRERCLCELGRSSEISRPGSVCGSDGHCVCDVKHCRTHEGIGLGVGKTSSKRKTLKANGTKPRF